MCESKTDLYVCILRVVRSLSGGPFVYAADQFTRFLSLGRHSLQHFFFLLLSRSLWAGDTTKSGASVSCQEEREVREKREKRREETLSECCCFLFKLIPLISRQREILCEIVCAIQCAGAKRLNDGDGRA